ncbi:MAG: c-type cytochrome domain-containing protein, partial [Aeoliella sp.]
MSISTVAAAQEKVTFDDHVKPIFRQHCLACHDAGGRSGDLALDSYNDAIAGGGSGVVVAAGDVDQSRLWRLVAHLDEPIMPPEQDKIPAEQLETIKAWIDGGLLENAGSKAMKRKKSAVAAFAPSADNRPAGEPAMPSGFYREPVVRSARAGVVAELAPSPWAPIVAVAGQRQVLLYHTDSHELLGVVPFVVGTPEVIRFSRNGDLLLVAGGKGAVLGVAHLWDVKTGRRIAELGDELDTYLAADISADHSLVALAGPRKRVQVFRTSDGSLAYEITKHTDWVTSLEFSPNGHLLVTA